MEVEIIRNHERVVKACGEIDLSNVDALSSALDEVAREAAKGFVVDMSGVTYVDSAGVQAILSAYRKVLNAGGRIVIIAAHPNLIEIFDIINASRLPGFFICGTMGEAEEVLAGAGVSVK